MRTDLLKLIAVSLLVVGLVLIVAPALIDQLPEEIRGSLIALGIAIEAGALASSLFLMGDGRGRG